MLGTSMNADTFIERWAGSGGAERANYGQFLSELCRVLEVSEPQPTKPDDADNAYVFERSVYDPHDEGKPTVRRIDLYKRGCFVLEAKQGVEKEAEEEAKVRQAKNTRAKSKKGHGTRGTKGWDTFMQRARQQAESYVRLLPDGEGRPPFILVVDVGHAIEVYAEFTRTGGVYRPFPDARRFRVTMDDLRKPEIRERLRAVWTDPLSLDPTMRMAEVTKRVADTLATISRSMEGQPDTEGRPMTPERVSGFLMRMIFTMFAEDVGLIPEHKFRKALEAMRGRPEAFVPSVQDLWNAMARGGYSVALQEKIKHFNGGLFEDVEVLPVTEGQLRLFAEAAESNWSEVEPSIFGTLVERALNPRERHKLGAHYTPRAYVERLVEQVVMVPLQHDWQNVRVEVQNVLDKAGEDARALRAAQVKARAFVERFVAQLRETTVMDPACGTGNFLYVSMELMKRLEAEAVETLVSLGGQAPLIGVNPEQFIGLELNPRGARVAELVLWIGYLQLYSREHGQASPPEPILKAFHNIREQDAVLTYDRRRPKVTQDGEPVTRWDGVSVIVQPTTGREVPDPTATVQDEVYGNPRPFDWPRTDFIVGNPPFIGAGPMRFALGDGYTETLRKTYPDVPESADFVMFWWSKAAQLLTSQGTGTKLRRFGFVTTNSLKQTFNRRVLARFMEGGLSLAYAVPDHPWVDEADGAAVRIAMTVAEQGSNSGVLTTVVGERQSGNGEYDITTKDEVGVIHPNLTVGVNVTDAHELKALEKLSGRGVQLMGAGFIITRKTAAELGLDRREGLEQHIREYRNGKDLTNRPRDVLVIDLFGLSMDDVRDKFPEVYQYMLLSVKPERDQNNRASYRDNWWLFGEPRKAFRPALAPLHRYIATVETSKHRFFQFLDASVLPDNKLVAIAHADAYVLGVLSSRIHVAWALAQGSNLGVGNDPVYVKTRCFETFPFPDATDAQKQAIRELAERLDAFRKERLAEHSKLTMTALYNVLEQVRAGNELDAKAKTIHDHGLVSTLAALHDDLDAAVAEAYGWFAGLPTQDILSRLLELNAIRAQEEKAGLVRYLRPEYQDPEAVQQTGLGMSVDALAPIEDVPLPFPGKLAEQAQLVRQVLQTSARPLAAAEIVKRFKGARKDRVEEIVEMLVELGQARQLGEHDVAFAA